MLKTFKYRLYPTPQQEKKMTSILDSCRILYNSALIDRQRHYQRTGRELTLTRQESQLLKDKVNYPILNTVHSQVLQDVLFRVKKAYSNFFRRVKEKNGKHGYPRFKFGKRYDSFTYPQYGYAFKIVNRKTLFLSKIGDVPIRMHRPVNGTIKTCVVKRISDGWYASISAEINTPAVVTDVSRPVGIDVGLTPLVTLSDGKTVEHPHYFRGMEKKLARAQRLLSRKVKGSKNYKKQQMKVGIIHKKISDSRNDFLHKLSRSVVDTFTFIAGDSIKITNLVKNNHLSKGIYDAGWSKMLNYIAYKAEEAGKRYVEPPTAGSTQECCLCGTQAHKDLSDRMHICSNIMCGLILPRDRNSALVALKRALNTAGTAGINAWGDLASTLRARIGMQAESLNQEKYSGCIITEKPRP